MKKTILLNLVFLWSILQVLAAHPTSNPVVIDNVRFTFITDGLVRMEYAEQGKFVDDKTLFAVNREPGKVNVEMQKKGDNYTFITSKMRVEYFNDGFPFGQTNLKVYFQLDGKEKRWYIASTQSKNLKGAITTLDDVSGPVERQEGLLSRDGWYLINDANKEILKDGWIAPRPQESIQDMYLFIYGNDYKSALKSLQTVSGSVPMTRKYIHGSWYCRWWNYTSDEYREIVKDYKEHNFPLDIMVFDMGWHTQKNAKVGTGHAGTRGWTGYSWNRDLIADPAGLIKEFNDDHIHVVLNEHPHDGIREHEDMYADFMAAMGHPMQKNLIFDAGDRKYMTNFMKYAHKESDDMGVAFWWLDWQQDYLYPVVRGTHMKHLAWLNHLYYDYSENNGQGLRGAGFSRWAGWGDHRHPIQFSGDAVANWDVLKFEVDLTATSGNVGCFFWAHDIGGFYGGKDPELYARWTQFGALSSSLRVHSVYDKNLDRRPWIWGKEAEESMRIAYDFRSRMMPYIYSTVWQCHNDMLPLNRAMYIDYPEEEEAYQNPQQFMLGDLLLAAPITSPRKTDGKAEQKVWLPKGTKWYDYFTSKAYDGGRQLIASCDLNTFPLYVKAGYPLVMQNFSLHAAAEPLNELVIRCYEGEEGDSHSYTLYEDDGLTKKYLAGERALTQIDYQKKDGISTLTVHPTEGSYEGQVDKRSYRLELGAEKISRVKVNGSKCRFYFDKEKQLYIVTVKAKRLTKEVVISYN